MGWGVMGSNTEELVRTGSASVFRFLHCGTSDIHFGEIEGCRSRKKKKKEKKKKPEGSHLASLSSAGVCV